MLRVAVPNKGILSDTAILMLKEAGYAVRRDPKDLHVVDETNGIEFFYLRPRDIATYVGRGSLDVGLTGLDLLLDSRSAALSVADLGFGGSTFRFAGPTGRFSSLAELEGKRVATAYPHLVEDFLGREGVSVDLVPLDGAVEVAVRLGVADAVADVVSTGNTLRQAGLEIFGPVLVSSAQLIVAPGRAFRSPASMSSSTMTAQLRSLSKRRESRQASNHQRSHRYRTRSGLQYVRW
ncbi:MAG: hypothetical protein RL645_930 [Actinomycetota bacterium]|jgi:ATP phosphoribosyltransferase